MQKIVKILIVITLVLALTLPGAAVFTDLGKPIDENTGNNPREDAPPYIPSNPNPKNGAIGVDINTNLSWNGGESSPLMVGVRLHLVLYGISPQKNSPIIHHIFQAILIQRTVQLVLILIQI